MKPPRPADAVAALPRESSARKIARQRKLRAILSKGIGLPRHELTDSLWPGYAETYRPEQSTLVS